MAGAAAASPTGGAETATRSTDLVELPDPSGVYGFAFWMTYAANTLLMVALSLLFRYADLVVHLGGSEFQLGLIVGGGMVGSLLMRFFQGVGIDRYGARLIWLLSVGLLVPCLLGHLLVTRVDSPAIYVLQIIFRTGVAGAFGASITSVFHRVPVSRMAEAVGTLGTSGFVGMIIGPLLGDMLLGGESISRGDVDRMFLGAAVLCAASLAAAWLATRDDRHGAPSRHRAPMLGVLKRYHPGPMLLMGVAMGFGVGLPGVFLRTYATELGLAHISLFFAVYAILAFTTRVATRRLPERIGNRKMILYGMSALVAAVLFYLIVDTHWQLAIPATFTGIAHALLFPAIVAGGSAAFPRRYRGLATSLMLAMFDVGMLVGSPLVGAILHYAATGGLPAYPTMFLTVAALLAGCTLFYAYAARESDRVPIPLEKTALAPGVNV